MRLRRLARKWDVTIFRDRHTHKHCIIIYISTTQNHPNHNHHHHRHHLTNHHQVSRGIVWRRGRRVSEDNSDLAGQATCWQAMQNLTNHHLRHHCHHHHQSHYLHHPGNHFYPRHCHLGQLECLLTGGGVLHMLPRPIASTSTSTFFHCHQHTHHHYHFHHHHTWPV